MTRPLVPLYAAATAARNAVYDRGLLKPRRLPIPVISIGNLNTGGTGKTPFVAALARLLVQAGRSPIILSRGYGRGLTHAQQVVPEGTAAQFGDEPILLANSTGVPVYVGADRYRAGLLAAEEHSLTPASVFLLDDGFQHRELARDMDIVLLSPHDLDDHALPSGNLREPLSSLSRADALVFTERSWRSQDADLPPRFLERFSHPSCGRPVIWTVRRWLDRNALATLPQGPAVAFAGIAHPEDFFQSLRADGVTLPGTLSFPDHHIYTFADITRILASLRVADAKLLLTTEKDLVRLSPEALEALEQVATVIAVPLVSELANAEVCLRQIDALCMRQS